VEQSRDPDAIKAEMEMLASSGYCGEGGTRCSASLQPLHPRSSCSLSQGHSQLYAPMPCVRYSSEAEDPRVMPLLMLSARRYKEVTLLGQNIDAYGRDLPGSAEDGSGRRKWTLTDLLR